MLSTVVFSQKKIIWYINTSLGVGFNNGVSQCNGFIKITLFNHRTGKIHVFCTFGIRNSHINIGNKSNEFIKQKRKPVFQNIKTFYISLFDQRDKFYLCCFIRTGNLFKKRCLYFYCIFQVFVVKIFKEMMLLSIVTKESLSVFSMRENLFLVKLIKYPSLSR